MHLSNNALIRVLSNLVALVFLEEHDDFLISFSLRTNTFTV